MYCDLEFFLNHYRKLMVNYLDGLTISMYMSNIFKNIFLTFLDQNIYKSNLKKNGFAVNLVFLDKLEKINIDLY